MARFSKKICAKACMAAALAVTLVAAPLAAPSLAWAKYTDVSTQYPASQDLSATASEGLRSIGKSIYGYVVQAGQIVDGTYVVPAYTSSHMCNFYASQDDATNKRNPNQVVLNVSGGLVTATFYMSGAYNALYFGSAEEAAALAPADGLTPSSSYLTDGTDSYDTGHGPFTIQLSSLNTEFPFAVYNGGTKGTAGGVWYNRLGSVIVTTDFAESYVVGAAPKPNPGGDTDDPGTGGSGGDGSDNGGAGAGGSAGGTSASGNRENSQAPSESSEAIEQGNSEIDSAAEEATAGASLRGKRISIVNANEDQDNAAQTVLEGQMISIEGLSPGQMAAIFSAIIAVAGGIASVVRFRVQLKGKSETYERNC